VDGVRLDLACALRLSLRQRVPTLLAILALALGIGANTTIFSFVSEAFLRPLPYPDADRLVMVYQDRSATGGAAREVISPGLFVDWSTRAAALEGISAIRNWTPNFAGFDGSGREEPERFSGAGVTGAYFTILGVAPALGRTFTAEDDRPGVPTAVVLSHRLWTRRFGADPRVIGRTFPLDGQPVTVIGVMPETFTGAVIDADLWNTMRIDPADAPRGIVMLRAIARLRPGVTLASAQAAMEALQIQLRETDPELAGAQARLVPLHDDAVGPVKPVLIVLSGSVVLVLLIACANVSSLLMARGSMRQAETSVRLSLGAGPLHLIRQSLVEGAVFAVPASVLGLGLAYAGVRSLAALAPPSAARLQDVQVDAGALLFTAAIASLATLLASLGPAWLARRANPAPARRAPGSAGLGRAGQWLIVLEIAAALALSVGAGLFVRSLIGLQHVDLGFRPERLLTASITPPRSGYRGREALTNLLDRALERVGQAPGVESVAFTSVLPLSGMQINFDFRIPGRPRGGPGRDPIASFRSVSPNFLRTMGMRIVSGRDFGADDREGSPMVVIVNEALVKRYWPEASPVGTRIRINGDEAAIIGIAVDVHHAGPGVPPEGEAYVPYSQLITGSGFLVARTKGDPGSAGPALRAAMRDVDPTLPLANLRTMETLAARSVAQPRFLAGALSVFSGVAAFLALVGAYGLMSFAVGRREREIGVRMALGATRESVLRLVVRQGLALAGLGVLTGVALSLSGARFVGSMLFGVGATDPVTLIVVSTLALVTSAVATYLPARRAATVDPVEALRED
jgi:putative ABC transport system permease protein